MRRTGRRLGVRPVMHRERGRARQAQSQKERRLPEANRAASCQHVPDRLRARVPEPLGYGSACDRQRADGQVISGRMSLLSARCIGRKSVCKDRLCSHPEVGSPMESGRAPGAPGFVAKKNNLHRTRNDAAHLGERCGQVAWTVPRLAGPNWMAARGRTMSTVGHCALTCVVT